MFQVYETINLQFSHVLAKTGVKVIGTIKPWTPNNKGNVTAE